MLDIMVRLSKRISEPSILVRPISKFGGLDNIHIALLVLVAILIMLLITVSYNTKIYVINASISRAANLAPGNSTNYSAIAPRNTASGIKLAAERILASYGTINSSLSLLPYLSNVAAANESYMPNTKQWFVSIPYTGPINGKKYLFTMTISDLNTSSFTPFVQTTSPKSVSNDYVISNGIVKLSGTTSCQSGSSVPVYWFIDPYAQGSMQSLQNLISLRSMFGSRVNVTLKILYAQASQGIAATYGLNNTMQLGKYLLCASSQGNFAGFVKAVNTTYQGTYIPAYQLQTLAGESGLNTTSLDACVASSQSAINAQAVQAKYYNITSSAAVLTSCEYLSIPQTAQDAVCYANPTAC